MAATNSLSVLCFGDSLTEGYHHMGFAFDPYSKRLEQLLRQNCAELTIVNKGVSGEHASVMGTRLAALLAERRYDWVIILGGTNDLAYDVDTKTLAETLIKLHSMCHEAGARTVALTIPECSYEASETGKEHTKDRENVNDLIREFSSKSGARTLLADLSKGIPYASLSKEDQKKFWDDGLHFTPVGYDKMADVIWEAMSNCL